MDAVEAIRHAIRQCGREVCLCKGTDTYRFTACIVPNPYSTMQESQYPRSRFGMEDDRRYLYYGPLLGGGELVDDGSILAAEDGQYAISMCHDFYYRENKMFRWAIARKIEGGVLDGPVQ